jgi:hypothetical protein
MRQSLNQAVFEELTAAALVRSQQAGFGDLAGLWEHDQAFDRIFASQRRIDPDQWK